MAAPDRRGTGTAVFGTTGTLTPVVPTHANNDILLCVVGSSANASVTPTHTLGGTWATLKTSTIASGTIRATVTVFWKRTTGGESNPTVTVTPTGSTACHHSAVVHSYLNCITTGNPWEGDTANSAAGAAAIALTLTTSAVDETGILATMHADNIATGVTDSNSYTTVTDTDDTTGIDGYLSIRQKVVGNGPGQGATVTFTSGGTGVGIAGVAFALKPIPTVTGTVSQTLGSVVPTASGDHFHTYGTLARTLASVTPTISGTFPFTGTVARTLGSVTPTASGTHSSGGYTSTALRFDSANDSLQSTAPPSDRYSMACWVYIAVDLNSYSPAVAVSENTNSFANNTYQLLGPTADGVTVEYYDDVVYPNGPANPVSQATGEWWFNGLIVDATGVTVYQRKAGDPTLTKTRQTTAAPVSITPGYLHVGGLYWPASGDTPTRRLNGRMRGLKIWDAVALTDAEMFEETKQFAPVRKDDLHAYYKLEDDSTKLTDSSGNGRTLTNPSGAGAWATEAGPDGIPEIANTSIRFNSAADVLKSTAPPSSRHAIGFWTNIRVDRNAYSSLIFASDTGLTKFHQYLLWTDGTTPHAWGTVGGVATNLATQPVSQAVDEWWFNFITITAGGTKIYQLKEGDITPTKTTSGVVNDTGTYDYLLISEDTLGDYLDGQIRGLKIWDNWDPTDAEVLAEAQQHAPVHRTDLWAYYPLSNSIDMLRDTSGKARDLTNLGGGGVWSYDQGPNLIEGATIGKFAMGSYNGAGAGATAVSVDNATTYTANTVTGSDMMDMAFNGQIFCACDYGGSAWTSPDGVVWTERTVGATYDWESIAWNGTVFCMVGYTGNKSATSPDGINWQIGTLPTATRWQSIASDGEQFVAVGLSCCATSPDGLVWTSRTISGGNWYIAWNGTTFCCVAYASDATTTSPDGITWTDHNAVMPSSANWFALAVNDAGLFVTATYGGTAAASSPDGAVWTPHTMPASVNWYSIAWNGTTFFAVADGSTSTAVSTDGLTWVSGGALPSAARWFALAAAYEPVFNSAVTGTLARTLASVTPTISGTFPFTGTVSQTLTSVTPTISGTFPFTGTVSQTLASVTPTASGAHGVSGSTARTLASVTPTITGTFPFTGTVSQTLGIVSPTISGAHGVSGTTARTLGSVIQSAAGTFPFTGTIAQTLAGLTRTITGAHGVSGSTAQTLASVTSSATGIATVTGTASQTLGSVTPTIAAAHGVSGSTSRTLGSVAPTITGTFPFTGTVSQTLGIVIPTITGTFPFTGTVSQTLASVTPTISGSHSIAGTLSQTLGSVVQSASGTFPFTGTISRTLASVTSSSSAAHGVSGTTTQTLASVTPTITGTVPFTGTVSQILGSVIPTIAGAHGISGTVSQTLGSVIPTISGTFPFTGTVLQTLGIVSPTISGAHGVSSALSRTLDSVVSTASGTFPFTGTTIQTLGIVSPTISGTHGVSGSTSRTLESVTQSATGTFPFTGTIAQTLATITPTIDAAHGVSGTTATTLGSVVQSASGNFGYDPAGTVFATLNSVAISASGTFPFTGTTDQTLDSVPSSASGAFTAPVTGTISQTLASVTPTISGNHEVVGTVSQTLGSVDLNSDGMFGTDDVFEGSLSATLATLSQTASGAHGVSGTVTRTLESVTQSASGLVAVSGTVGASLGSVTVSADGFQSVGGTLSRTLSAVTQIADGEFTLSIVGTVSNTLGSITQSAEGFVAVDGFIAEILNNVTQSASGTFPNIGEITATLGSILSGITGTHDTLSLVTIPLMQQVDSTHIRIIFSRPVTLYSESAPQYGWRNNIPIQLFPALGITLSGGVDALDYTKETANSYIVRTTPLTPSTTYVVTVTNAASYDVTGLLVV